MPMQANSRKSNGKSRKHVMSLLFERSGLLSLSCIAAVLLCTGCKPTVQRTHAPRPGNKYATGFQIDDTLGINRVRVFAPWKADSVMATYLVAEPLERIGASSATHIGMLAELGLMDKLVGMCNPEVSYHELPETCQHLGDAMQPDVERIIANGVQAMLYSTYSPSDQSAERMESVGINVLYNNEWRESTPLARAEWIRFVAVFFGKLDVADSIFSEVEKAYCGLRDNRMSSQRPMAKGQQPSVLSGLDFRGTWYVPAGGTYMGALFKDAGASYAFADDERESSIPLTFEQALLTFADADVWLGCNVPSREALLEMNSQHALFKAYKTGRLYNFRKRCTPSGANDFWESGVVHPERILQDIIATLDGDTTFYYINPVK